MTIDQRRAEAVAAAYTAAWNTIMPEAVAELFAESGQIVINRGSPWEGRDRVAEVAAGFFAEVPDLRLACDSVRAAGEHLVYLWTFTSTHSGTGDKLRIAGWEE